MRHRCLLGAREISTLAKSVSIDNHEPLAKSKLELLARETAPWTAPAGQSMVGICRKGGRLLVGFCPKEVHDVNIEVLREKIAQGQYVVSFTHTEKLRHRQIKALDIEQAIQTGFIIEAYPGDPRGASCLLLGFVDKRPLH